MIIKYNEKQHFLISLLFATMALILNVLFFFSFYSQNMKKIVF